MKTMIGSIKGRDAAIMAVIAILASLVAYGVVRHTPVQLVENIVDDLRVVVMTAPEPRHEDVVIVTITEDTLSNFPYRSPVNRAFLANLVTALEAKGARAIGIDILFDTPTDPEADALLYQTLAEATVPIAVSYADTQQLTEGQQEFIDAFSANVSRGYANVVTNALDGVVRDVFPGRDNAGAFVTGLPGALARKVGVEPPEEEVRLVYRGIPEDAAGAEDAIFRPFKRYPAHSAHLLPDAWFQDKIVMIGAELTDIDLDLKKTPYATAFGDQAGQIPGVMIHAHALAQMLDGKTFPAFPLWAELALVFGFAVVGVLFAKLQIPLWATVGGLIAVLAALWFGGFHLFGVGGPMIPLIEPTLAFVVAASVGVLYAGQADRQQKKFIKDAFARYLPPTLVDQLVDNPDMLKLRGERRDITLIFTDVAGFTTISENLPPTTLVHVLSEYMDGMTRIILEHGGTIDKFIGDAVMALFGAPVDQDDHPQRAARCAVALDAFARDFETRATDESGQPCAFGHTRIGVHTGECTVGNFGSEQKFDYTALGDTVNAAARLESLNKQFGTRVALSQQTVERTQELDFRAMGSVIVKGKTEPIDIY
ncbi:MAG: adenylate/guanylate cyclase domain-containing protein, partial [Pseudomonadota bacterium]